MQNKDLSLLTKPFQMVYWLQALVQRGPWIFFGVQVRYRKKRRNARELPSRRPFVEPRPCSLVHAGDTSTLFAYLGSFSHRLQPHTECTRPSLSSAGHCSTFCLTNGYIFLPSPEWVRAAQTGLEAGQPRSVLRKPVTAYNTELTFQR